MRQDYRTFTLLSMKDVHLLEERYELREIPEERLGTSKFGNEVKEQVKLRVHKDIWDQMVLYFGEENVILTRDTTSFKLIYR